MSYSLDILNKLNQIETDKDIKALSYAIYPGTHCPLFGVALTASYVKNLGVIVIGTGECTYYTKNFAYHRQKGQDKVYSLVLKEQDVVFGAGEKVKEAVKEIAKEEGLEVVMLVSTCVPELIGEDYDGLKDELKEDLGIPVLSVKTEHFKCSSHIPGMTRTLGSLIELMEESQGERSDINILGHRQGDIEQTEVMQLLKAQGVKVRTTIPSKCTLEELKKASSVKLNIVTDHIALELAEAMKEKFDIPYIYFGKAMDQKVIRKLYEIIEETLDIKLLDALSEKEKEYNELLIACKEKLSGKKLIYGNTPMMVFETVDFLSDLGLEPIFIQVRELYEVDLPFKERLLEKGYNPYISRIANIAPLRELYETIGADIYIGHENPMLLREKGLLQMTFDEEAQKVGYELPIGIMKHILGLLDLEGMGHRKQMMGGRPHGNL